MPLGKFPLYIVQCLPVSSYDPHYMLIIWESDLGVTMDPKVWAYIWLATKVLLHECCCT